MTDAQVMEKLRRIVDELLLCGNDQQVQSFVNSVIGRARSQGVPWDGKVFMEYWSDLIRTGVVAVPGDYVASLYGGDLPRLLLTERGRRLLEHGEQSPHNLSKYLSALQKRVSVADPIALSYLQEAIEAWRCGLNRSSAVMLGCACEQLVLLLAETVTQSRMTNGATSLEKKLKRRTFISELFDDVRSTLIELAQQKKLSREFADALDRKLGAIFDHARGLRNQSGHPTGVDVTSDDAEAGLLLFPGFYELVDKLIAQLRETR